MYRSLVISLTAIIVILAATATTVAAQGRGFHGGGGSVFRGAPAVRSAPGPAFFSRPAAPVVHGPVAPFVTSPVAPFGRSPGAPFGFGRFPSGIGGRFPRTVVVPPVIYSPYFWSSSIYGYGGLEYYPYPASAYSEPVYSSPAVPTVSQTEVDLAYQVGRLSAEVDQLRQQQTITSFTQPPAQPQQAPQQRTATPIVLVFRDGHRMEIQNYAIVGQTLWVLDERAATKIPISDLDLDATQKENRGIGLRLPSQEK